MAKTQWEHDLDVMAKNYGKHVTNFAKLIAAAKAEEKKLPSFSAEAVGGDALRVRFAGNEWLVKLVFDSDNPEVAEMQSYTVARLPDVEPEYGELRTAYLDDLSNVGTKVGGQRSHSIGDRVVLFYLLGLMGQ